MLKNKLIEKLLCERYKIKNKNCDCNLLENNVPNLNPVEVYLWLTKGPKIPVDIIKSLLSEIPSDRPDLSADENGEPSTKNIQQPYDFNRNYLGAEPRTTRVREFGQATGQVISPR